MFKAMRLSNPTLEHKSRLSMSVAIDRPMFTWNILLDLLPTGRPFFSRLRTVLLYFIYKLHRLGTIYYLIGGKIIFELLIAVVMKTYIRIKPSKKACSACNRNHAGFLLRLFFKPEDGHHMSLRNVG
jgi:hypothetical protein